MNVKPKPRSKRKSAAEPVLVLEGNARLEAVAEEVRAFFGYPDRDQQLRYILASEWIISWIEAMGIKIDRPFDLRQMCQYFVEMTGPLPIGVLKRQ